jgi:hypothetical protein
MVRPLPSVALAWLFLVALFPGIGLLCYLGFGERQLGGRRVIRLAELREPYMRRLREMLHRVSANVEIVPSAARALPRRVGDRPTTSSCSRCRRAN